MLGSRYLNGNGITKDLEKSFYWYQKVAEQEDVRGQSQLGFMYENGKGVQTDFKLAFYWLKKAAEQGDAGAQIKIGYDMGEGESTELSYGQPRKMDLKEFNNITIYKMFKATSQMDSALREHGYQLKTKDNGHYYLDKDENMISSFYQKDQQILFVDLTTYDFDYYKRLRKQISDKYLRQQNNFLFGEWTCEVYESGLGLFMVGYGSDNSFLIGSRIPLGNYE